jgi:hypothetical protein
MTGASEAAATKMTLTSAGKFGIGTTAAEAKLHVIGAASGLNDGTIALFEGNNDGGNRGIHIGQEGTGSQAWPFIQAYHSQAVTNYWELLLNPYGGNVGIGTTDPANLLQISTAAGQSDTYGNVQINYTGTGVVNSGLTVKNYGGTSQFMQWENNGVRIGSRIITNSGVGDVIFTAGADSEKMRITAAAGNLLVNTTTEIQLGLYTESFPGTTKRGAVYNNTESFNGSNFISFADEGAIVGTIVQNGATTVLYSTASDYRLKNTITPMIGALAKVALLKPVTYKWNEDGSDAQGFIAHELQAVVPDCVSGEKDAVDAEGKPQYQGVDTSFLVATLTAAIQEQQALIEALTTRITALEG